MSVASVSPAVSTIDMRSDTVTKPTAAMRAAMAAAPVGDDVFGDDEVGLELQRTCARLLGKEAGLFVPSGTMGNLLATMLHCDARGGEMVLGDQSHIHFYEQGNSAQFGGVHSRTVRNQPDGTMLIEDIERAIRPVGDDHLPLSQLIVLEQTHNRAGGRILPVAYIDEVGALAKKKGLKLHIDGARLLNASVALGVSPARMVEAADSVCLCLSKGLGAPIGSVLVGSAEFIRRARRLRKALGGGMRQIGVLAAAGLLAVNEQVKCLETDHAHAKELARGLQGVAGLIVPPIETVETNILYLGLDKEKLALTAAELNAELKQQGLLLAATDTYTLRFVTHHQVSKEQIHAAVEIVKKAAAAHVRA